MSRTKVLVVDDDPSLRRALDRLLQREGFDVVVTDNSTQALAIVRTQEPALALVDIHMPGSSSGFDLCRRIREWMKTEVILMSGVFTSEEDRCRAYREGAVDFVVKPCLVEDIARGFRRVFDEPRPLLQCSARHSGAVKVEAPPSLGKVLVIEDNEQMLSAMSLHLECAGFLPYPASTARRGIFLAHALKPEAIILDVGLPDMRGDEVLEILRLSPRTKDIPTLVWTGTKKRDQEKEFLEGGAAQYLIKGVNDIAAVPFRVKRALGIKEPEMLEKGPVKLNVGTRAVWVCGEAVGDLSPKEFDLLAYLVGKSPAIAR
jgi:two-component system KDP operon response regulator KdpE